MNPSILVLNTGSSSIKFAVFGADEAMDCQGRGEIEGIGGDGRLRTYTGAGLPEADLALGRGLDHQQALRALIEWARQQEAVSTVIAIGHRIVHGGAQFSHAVRLDANVIAALDALTPLAPLHQPHNLAGVRALAALAPGVPQIACFDTAFHQTQAPLARAYALPRAQAEAGVKRYGFHGLSFEYIASVLPDYLNEAAHGRVIVAHLGNGASLCALKERRSVATTMGFTPLDGLVMGTRCGALDPGVVLYLLAKQGMEIDEVTDLLYNQSGLLGVSGMTHDMRLLLESEDADAQNAVDLFVYRVTRELGSLVAALGGLDALVFTGGIGENAAVIRARICRDAQWLGVTLDESTNDSAGAGARISAAASKVSVWVIATREDLMIARQTLQVVRATNAAR